MTKIGTREAIVATIACVLTIAAVIAAAIARPVGGGRGYAVLSLDEAVVDREAVAALSAAGIDGVVSESTQWVYVDSFDGLEKIPLDRYRDRIESFDPRDDGYADRLRSFFVSDGRRRLYVPDASASRLRVIAALFPDADYTVEAPPRSAAIGDLVLCVVAALVATLVCGTPWILAAAIPALVSLAPFGSAGLAAAGLLAASLHAAADSAREVLRAVRGAKRFRERPWLLDGVPPALLFLGGAVAACAFGGIPIPVTALSLSAGFAAAIAAIEHQELRRSERGHGRFSPVNMSHRFSGMLSSSRTAFPFAGVALVSLCLAMAGLGQGKVQTARPAFALTEEEYRSHIDFQRSFSVTKLDSAESGPYGRYRIGTDGLVAEGSEQDYARESGKLELPPAERLISLAGSAGPTSRSIGGPLAAFGAVLAAATPTIVHALRKRKRAKGIEALAEKRIAA